MRIAIDDPNMIASGIEVGVKGFKSNPSDADDVPTQVYIEFYDGKLQIHVWDGGSESPQTIKIDRLEPINENRAA